MGYKYTPTNVPATSYPNVGHGQTIIPDASTDALGADNTSYWFGMKKPVYGFPATEGDTDDAVCPSGFIVPRYYDLKNVIDRTKAYEDIKEFVLRLPTNAFVNRDLFHFGNYPYAPKLWVSKIDFSENNPGGTPSSTRTNSTDYYYAWYGAPTTDYKFNGSSWYSPKYSYDNTLSDSNAISAINTETNIPHLRIIGTYRSHGRYVYGYNYYTDATHHSPSSSFPIRCRKQ